MKPLTAIAVSGGIDSLMAAYLLKKQGYPVIGIHFVTGYEDPACSEHETNAPPTSEPLLLKKNLDRALKRAALIGDQVGMRVELLNCAIEFQKTVVDYFTRTYRSGRTPNPCLVCNPSIKFGPLLSFARKLGASRLATGHYAGVGRDSDGRYRLHRGFDKTKDQSYFLAMMTQDKLAAARFPLGQMKKTEVKKLAVENGLKPLIQRESQDICFIKGNSYGTFLSLQPGFEAKPGKIEDVRGNILGKHDGLHLFTIGQRRGINCPASRPYYVVRIDTSGNRLIVGSKEDLLSRECNVFNINWVIQKPAEPIKIFTRVRFRHTAAASTLFPTGKDTARVRFDRPQSAITPGQGAVFYLGDDVLGGGWIA